jgi:hypothetical protein
MVVLVLLVLPGMAVVVVENVDLMMWSGEKRNKRGKGKLKYAVHDTEGRHEGVALAILDTPDKLT